MGSTEGLLIVANKWNLIVDVALCNGCRNCQLSAMDEYLENSEKGYFAPADREAGPLLKVETVERKAGFATDVSYVPVMCNHCDDAPCAKVALDGAVRKRADGIVVIDPVKARGQRQIVDACPYGVAVWNEKEDLPQIWVFDAHLLDRGWTQPRCVQACPTGALRSIKTSDAAMAAIVQKEGLLPPDSIHATKPRVWYKTSGRMGTHFVAGHVEQIVNGQRECVVGLNVSLRQGETVVAESQTDEFGDFKLNGINARGEPCRVTVGQTRFDVGCEENTCLPDLVLQADLTVVDG